MITKKINPNEFPLCEEIIERINNQFIHNGWISLYDETNIYAVLISDDILEKTKKYDSWDLNWDYSHPRINELEDSLGYNQYYKNGIVPIVTYQSEKSTYPKRLRLSDEFILFYDLRDEKNKDCIEYHIVDECGDSECIAKIKPNQVEVQVKYIKEFIAVKEMSLLIQFDTLKYSDKSLKEYGYTTKCYQIYNTDEYVFGYSLIDNSISNKLSKPCAYICGKIWITPAPKNIKKLWNYHDLRKETFIIGVDDNGVNIESTCDENQLPNIFTRKGDEPYTLSLVFFKKEVLSKYYEKPEKYSVSEGYMNAPEWFLRFDNDRTDNYVVAVLVDLCKIPYKEQQHWRQYNIAPPMDAEISETTKKRWFWGESSNTSNAPDFLFKFQLHKTNNVWKQKFGWELFKQLAKKDQYHIDTLHTMSERENDKEFDGLILSITKIVIDSLNEEEIINATDGSNSDVVSFLKSKNCSVPQELEGSIAKFEALLISLGYSDCDITAQFRDIQKLRSTTVAHRKSSNPEKKQEKLFARFGLDKTSQQEAFNKVLLRLVDNLKELENIAENCSLYPSTK